MSAMRVIVTAEFVDIETEERRRPGTVMDVTAERAARLIQRGLAETAPEQQCAPTTAAAASKPAAKPRARKRR